MNCHFKETGLGSLSYRHSFCLTSAVYIISRTLFPFCRHMFRTWHLYTHTHTKLSPQGPVRKQPCYQVSQLRVQIKRGLVSHNCANSIQVCWSAAKIRVPELIHRQRTQFTLDTDPHLSLFTGQWSSGVHVCLFSIDCLIKPVEENEMPVEILGWKEWYAWEIVTEKRWKKRVEKKLFPFLSVNHLLLDFSVG